MRSLAFPFLVVLLLTGACAKRSNTPRVKPNASADTAISPADAAGLYLDSAKAAEFTKTGHVSEADCQASWDQREAAVKIFQFSKDNSISAFDPRTAGGDVYFSSDHGSLVPNKDELKSTADRSYSYSLRRKAGRVRMHSVAKDLKTGKSTESDQPLSQISEANAKDFLDQEAACAQRPVDISRLTTLPLGSAQLSYEAPGAKDAKQISVGAHSAQSLSCEAGADGVKIAIGSGIKLQVPASDLDGAKKPVGQADLAFDGQKLDIVCEASVKRSGGVVDGSLDCGNSSAGHLSGSFACRREAAGSRQ